ncbi:MAG: M48 family metalloprotease [Chloroflexi bacterium]|nr:M48 family metalloprotease [Chloroflexota bacterium]
MGAVEPALLPPASADEPPDSRRHRDPARTLAATRRRLLLASPAVSFGTLVLVAGSGTASGLLDRMRAVLGAQAGLAAYAVMLLLLLTIGGLPVQWLRGYVVPRRYGLSRQTFWAWLLDWLKAALVGLAFETIAVVGLYAAIDHFGSIWWLPYGELACAVIIFVGFVAPYLLVPLFYRMQPVSDHQLATRIQALADRAGTMIQGVAVLDFSRKTAEANAAVIGLARSRRVVLSDTLLEQFRPAEIEAVVAHEIGHHVHRDVPLLIVLQSAIVFLGCALLAQAGGPILATLGVSGGVGNPAGLPWILLGAELLAVLAMPGTNALSRLLESRADTFALNLIDDPRELASALRRLARVNLAEERPPRWAELLLASHPALEQRVDRAWRRWNERAA